jgi:hypothetical protein
MRKKMVLVMLLFTSFAKAQFSVEFGGGFTNKSAFGVNLEAGYLFKEFHVDAGYLIPISTLANVPKVFFGQVGKQFKLSENKKFDVGAGIALHNYRELQLVKTNVAEVSVYKPVNASKMLMYAAYETHFLPEAAFTFSAYYTGGFVYGGAGIRFYFMKNTKKEKKENEKTKKALTEIK